MFRDPQPLILAAVAYRVRTGRDPWWTVLMIGRFLLHAAWVVISLRWLFGGH